ncbi:hypothetical protein Egran_02541 [Elaphomyces granulatus]|uniref:Kinetochore protein fta7 n=1 Tax=Elaphomyces granulatus TaxID=519963 RepID=A0A232M053_9EURO|nr:hypothetical protein Egran_02541 [Elaphomyces granulatus]
MAPKRKRSTGAEDNNIVSSNKKPFAYLKPRVRRVSERTVKSKWTTLSEPVQEKISDMLRSLERPVIVRHRDERKRIEAQTAVGAVVKSLVRRLPRMPFPPVAKDVSFDYEAALDEHRSLESQLATVLNSIDLLNVEIDREDDLLSKDTTQLEEMEKNAKRAEAERKRQMKNEHAIFRHLDNSSQNWNRMPTEFSVPESQESDVALCDLDSDPEILSLTTRLSRHMQSMQDNIAPLAGLRDAILQSQAALDFLSIPAD